MHVDIYKRRADVSGLLPGRASNFINQRQSPRVLLAVPLEVSGKRANKSSFMEETKTIIVDSHKALLTLREPVRGGQILTLKNDATREHINCTVVDIFSGQDGVPEVAIEFSEPCPRFWRVTFPPVDWSPRSPEAKKYAVESTVIKAPLVKK
jgi:hypothetical protein